MFGRKFSRFLKRLYPRQDRNTCEINLLTSWSRIVEKNDEVEEIIGPEDEEVDDDEEDEEYTTAYNASI